MMPDNSVNSPTKKLVDSQNNMCLMCKTNVIDFCLFKQTAYGNNPSVTKLLRDIPRHSNHVVCKRCHTTLWNNCIIECISCCNNTFRKLMFMFHQERYGTSLHSTFANAKFDGNKMYICKTCDRNFQDKFVYVSYGREVTKKMCKIYQKDEYDFKQFVVLQCLGECISETDSSCICLSCHTALTTTNIENPVVLYHIKEGKIRDGANFLKALNEKLEYVCTCCHQLLFCKTVRNFLIDEYDNTNEVVQNCLSHQYKSKQNAIQRCHGIFGQTHDETPDNNGCSSNSGHNYMENEFICICCRNCLRQKKTKMPDQACANGLHLDDVPEDLHDISPLERRIISLRIPFITLIVMCRYGGHYKMNGPLVNVPTTLDHVIKILPCMSNHLNLSKNWNTKVTTCMI